MSINVGIAGLGVVAQGLLELASTNSERLSAIAAKPLCVTRVASRRLREEAALGSIPFSTDLDDLVNDDDLDLVIELIGGTDAAYDLIKACLNRGRGVITANKAVLATHGNELLEIARERHVPLAFEAAVAGGIPIIAALKTRFPANSVNWITGIINGTCNYILTAMSEEGVAFEDALRRAQELGYAEADPTFDVGGMDAAQKLAILVALAFDVPIEIDEVYCEGIQDITIDDIRHADEFGYSIKHLAIGRQEDDVIEMRVHPALVPKDNLLARVNDVENAVQLGTTNTGVLRFTGPGAGGHATASSVIADLTNIASGLYQQPGIGGKPLQARRMGDVSSEFFLSIAATDRPGVIASIGEILASHGISIASMVQKQEEVVRSDDSSVIPVVILTNSVVERELDQSLQELESLDDIASPIKKIRVVDLA
ncbi:MAG: homoserine dehydrogenase [Gammaproteobacteria bacterium]|nr:homoserine dehydrogenase [Gammaproteobacteria bacterium]